MNISRVATLLILPSVFCGCVPFPNFRYYAPAVSGVALRDGVPVERAEIRVTGQFAKTAQTGTTDKYGRFVLQPIRSLLLTSSLMGDPLYSYTVQIVADGKVYDGYSEASVGYAPKTLELTCNLSRSIQFGRKQFFCSPTNAIQ
jgi:hypothetical protein